MKKRHREKIMVWVFFCAILPVFLFHEASAQGKHEDTRPYRARDLGIRPGIFQPGPKNAITDVPGVRVGHVTLIQGDSIRTGVTSIIFHNNHPYYFKLPAGFYVGNGYGKFAGTTQIEELGEIETPLILTNTLSVFTAANGILDYMYTLPKMDEVRSINPIVGECNDGWLNAIQKRVVTRKHILEAIRRASSQRPAEGSVGAGTGMMALGWKGGIGTSSRVLPESLGGYIVGTLVLANYGGIFTMDGVPIGKETGRYPWKKDDTHGGSVIVVIITNAPLTSHELRRLAKRGLHGIARTGAFMSHGSGDYVLAVSNNILSAHPYPPETFRMMRILPQERLTPLFQAVIESVEESVYNALLRARTVNGYKGHRGEAIPYELVVRIGKRYGRNWSLPSQQTRK